MDYEILNVDNTTNFLDGSNFIAYNYNYRIDCDYRRRFLLDAIP